MGVAVAGAVPAAGPGGRPGYWFLLRGVVLGQIVGTLCLWLTAIALLIVRFRIGSHSLFAPWAIDGVWSLGAAIGWGILVSAVIGAAVRDRVCARTGVSLSGVLTLAAVAAGGYGPWLVATTPGGRLVLTALATSALLWGLAFDRSGEARRLPRRIELTRGGLGVLVLGGALTLVAPYALFHVAPRAVKPPLVVYAGLDTSAGIGAKAAKALQGEAELGAGPSPITVLAVRVTGTGGAKVALRIGAPPFSGDSPLSLPTTIAPRQTLWLGFSVTIRPCGRLGAAVIRVRVTYLDRGEPRTQTSPVVHNDVTEICP